MDVRAAAVELAVTGEDLWRMLPAGGCWDQERAAELARRCEEVARAIAEALESEVVGRNGR